MIKGLLAAIGVILILKQIPHLLGHDTDPEGDMAFVQPDHENTLHRTRRAWLADLHRRRSGDRAAVGGAADRCGIGSSR